MLKDQPWIHLAPHMREEYEQCLLEGLPVESFKDRILEVIQSRDEAAARALCDEMHKMAPKGPKDGYPFVEPSDYALIVRESPRVKADKKRPADSEMLKKTGGSLAGSDCRLSFRQADGRMAQRFCLSAFEGNGQLSHA